MDSIKKIIQLNIIRNAQINGWSITNPHINTYILTKKLNKLDNTELHNSSILIDNLLNITKNI